MPGKRKRPGLTIHILEDGEYTPCAQSVAFPTWSARQIHAAALECADLADFLRRLGLGRRAPVSG